MIIFRSTANQILANIQPIENVSVAHWFEFMKKISYLIRMPKDKLYKNKELRDLIYTTEKQIMVLTEHLAELKQVRIEREMRRIADWKDLPAEDQIRKAKEMEMDIEEKKEDEEQRKRDEDRKRRENRSQAEKDEETAQISMSYMSRTDMFGDPYD